MHVHVSATTFEVTGAPFTHCSLRVVEPSRRAFHIDFGGGTCSAAVDGGGKALTYPDGTTAVVISGDSLTVHYSPPRKDLSSLGLGELAIHVNRVKK